MFRCLMFFAVALVAASSALAADATIKGDYLETRTCDVYTGPCFANAQVGLAGQEAVMAWQIKSGRYEDQDLAGLTVVMALRASDTLGFGGGLTVNPDPIKSVVIVDEKATQQQRDALVHFAVAKAARVAGETVKVVSAPIEMSVDRKAGVGKLAAGKLVNVLTRALGNCDCVCTNERVFYPPLTKVHAPRPAFTVEGHFTGSGLGTTWSNPNTRSAFLAAID